MCESLTHRASQVGGGDSRGYPYPLPASAVGLWSGFAAGGFASVAASVFGAGVVVAVVVVVAEVPGCAGVNGLVAAGAVGGAGCDDWCPSGAEFFVLPAVSAVAGLGEWFAGHRPSRQSVQ